MRARENLSEPGKRTPPARLGRGATSADATGEEGPRLELESGVARVAATTKEDQ